MKFSGEQVKLSGEQVKFSSEQVKFSGEQVFLDGEQLIWQARRCVYFSATVVTQPRPTHILYQCAKFGNDRTSFNVIFDVCDV